MPADRPMNAAIREKKRKAEQRKMYIFFICFLLLILIIGGILGFLIGNLLDASAAPAYAEESYQYVEEQAGQEEQKISLYDLDFVSDERTLDKELQATMIEMCEKYDVPFALVLAVAEQESRFNPSTISRTRDYGIMQINKVNHKWLRNMGIEPLDRKGNVEAGVLMLSNALKSCNTVNEALMIYNCGAGGAKRLWKKGVYSTKYSRETMGRFDKWDKYINENMN